MSQLVVVQEIVMTHQNGISSMGLDLTMAIAVARPTSGRFSKNMGTMSRTAKLLTDKKFVKKRKRILFTKLFQKIAFKPLGKKIVNLVNTW